MDESGLTKWHWMVQYPQNLKIGKYVDIGAFTYLNALYRIEIEDFVQIGSHCSIYSISTIDGRKGKVTIKRNARIGSHTVVLPGVTIGENSIIGAFSLVKEDIPSNVIAFGVPARIYRRLTEDEIKTIIEAIKTVEETNSEGE
ncbi:MAG: acyltransferase [Candidatus Verstraetearchaeota archaeon]|nr:acyltransferase [Candidatus Verstraetearchaeota archaeon]